MSPDEDRESARPADARRRDGEAARCAVCGARIDPKEWHPVRIEEADDFRVLAFCDETCLTVWQE